MAAAPELREALAQRLRELGIAAVTAEHPQVFTVEEMMPHVQHMKGGHSKNLFLKDKKKKGFWLVTVLHNRFMNPWRRHIFAPPRCWAAPTGTGRRVQRAAVLELLPSAEGDCRIWHLF